VGGWAALTPIIHVAPSRRSESGSGFWKK